MTHFDNLVSFYNKQPFDSNYNNKYTSNHQVEKMIHDYANANKKTPPYSPIKKNNLEQVDNKNVNFNMNEFKNINYINYVVSSKELSGIYVNNDNGKLSASLV